MCNHCKEPGGTAIQAPVSQINVGVASWSWASREAVFRPRFRIMLSGHMVSSDQFVNIHGNWEMVRSKSVVITGKKGLSLLALCDTHAPQL